MARSERETGIIRIKEREELPTEELPTEADELNYQQKWVELYLRLKSEPDFGLKQFQEEIRPYREKLLPGQSLYFESLRALKWFHTDLERWTPEEILEERKDVFHEAKHARKFRLVARKLNLPIPKIRYGFQALYTPERKTDTCHLFIEILNTNELFADPDGKTKFLEFWAQVLEELQDPSEGDEVFMQINYRVGTPP